MGAAPNLNARTMRNYTAWLFLPLLTSCFALSSTEAPKEVTTVEPVSAPAQVEPAVDAEAAAKKKKELTGKLRDLEWARMELKIERQKLTAAARKAQDEVEEAEHAFKKAAAELEHYTQVEQPLELARAQLGLDRAEWAMEEDRQELEELRKLYADNQVESTTKELVIQRSEKKLAFAKLSVEHEQTEFNAKKNFELPTKLKSLERAKVEAEKSLRDARADKTRVADENELELRKSEAKLDDLEQEIKELGGTVPAEPKKENTDKKPSTDKKPNTDKKPSTEKKTEKSKEGAPK